MPVSNGATDSITGRIISVGFCPASAADPVEPLAPEPVALEPVDWAVVAIVPATSSEDSRSIVQARAKNTTNTTAAGTQGSSRRQLLAAGRFLGLDAFESVIAYLFFKRRAG